MDRIICVVGPTASGKTALAVRLALALCGEVVSCDSMQIYRRMDIGTAKPSTAELCGVRHHMLDVAEPEESYSVSRFVQEADVCVQEILARGKTVILAGGTGLYIDALVAGRRFAPYPQTGKRKALELRADREGMQALLQALRAVDPDAAERLHPADRKRILRALEVYEETGKTITQHNLETQQVPPKYSPVWIGLDMQPRQLLYDRIDLRVDQMLQAGLFSEVQALLREGVPIEATSMQAIGYKEAAACLHGGLSRQDAVAQIKKASRNYAKRQLTWFRRNPAIHWITRRENTTETEIFEKALAVATAFDREE